MLGIFLKFFNRFNSAGRLPWTVILYNLPLTWFIAVGKY